MQLPDRPKHPLRTAEQYLGPRVIRLTAFQAAALEIPGALEALKGYYCPPVCSRSFYNEDGHLRVEDSVPCINLQDVDTLRNSLICPTIIEYKTDDGHMHALVVFTDDAQKWPELRGAPPADLIFENHTDGCTTNLWEHRHYANEGELRHVELISADEHSLNLVVGQPIQNPAQPPGPFQSPITSITLYAWLPLAKPENS